MFFKHLGLPKGLRELKSIRYYMENLTGSRFQYPIMIRHTCLDALSMMNDLMNWNFHWAYKVPVLYIYIYYYSIANIYLHLDKLDELDWLFYSLLVVFSVIFMKYFNWPWTIFHYLKIFTKWGFLLHKYGWNALFFPVYMWATETLLINTKCLEVW